MNQKPHHPLKSSLLLWLALFILPALACYGNGMDEFFYCLRDYDACKGETLTTAGRDEAQAITGGPAIQFSPARVAEGDTVGTTLDVGVTAPGSTMEWDPPNYAHDFQFTIQPEPGGPPFVWKNLTGQEVIGASFKAGQWSYWGAESMLTVKLPDGSESHATTRLAYLPDDQGQSDENSPANSPLPPVPANTKPASANRPMLEEKEMWGITRVASSDGLTLTTAVCNDILDSLQSDSAFLGLRLPVAAESIAETAILPVNFTRGFTPSVNLAFEVGGVWQTLTLPLEYKFDRFDFLHSTFPAESNERWVALGVAESASPACPDGLNVSPDLWRGNINLWLDVPDEAMALPFCYFYDGAESPLEAQGLARMLQLAEDNQNTPGSVCNYQGNNITGLGDPLNLGAGAVNLMGNSVRIITPTQTISMSHMLLASLSAEIQPITITYSSNLTTTWHLYEGSYTGPDANKPITGPIDMISIPAYVWITTTVPSTIPAGSYTLVLTATAKNGQSAAGEDSIWVGEWVAPPSPPETPRVDLFLPLILR